MDTRTDWDTALRHEDARVARYGRPAAVLVVRIRVRLPGGADHYAGRVGMLLREQARETDRVARASQDRFHVLLPETTAAQAEALAERVRNACARLIPGQPRGEIEVVASASAAARGRTLHEALRAAQGDTAD
jgi:GGDEF domain-containing protein